MKESTSEVPKKEKKVGSSILSSAKKALNAMDPAMEKSDDDDRGNNGSEDSKTDVRPSNKESKNSASETISTFGNINKFKSSRKEDDSRESKKTEFNSVTQRFNHYITLIQEDRQKFIVMVGLGVGIILILLGISLLFGTSDKVSDNVVFGERSVTSAFFIIAGLLLIAAVYAPKIIGKTSFDGMYQEMKGVEADNSSKKEKNNSKEEDSKNNSLNEIKSENNSSVKTEIPEKDPKNEK